MKKILFVLMLCVIVPSTISAKKKPFGNGLFWEVTADGTLIISGQGDMPSCFDDLYKSRKWFKEGNQGKISKIVVEEGVTSIGNDAFHFWANGHTWCESVKSVSLPSTLLRIGTGAFEGQWGLKNIEIPNNVESIGSSAFRYVPLEKVKLPQKLKTIGESAFGATKLKKIEIPASVLTIGNRSFFIRSLEEIVFLGNNIQEIGDNVVCNFKGTIVNMPSIITLTNCEQYGIARSVVDNYYSAVFDDDGRELLPRKAGRRVETHRGASGEIVYYTIRENGKFGILDPVGKWIITPEQDEVGYIGGNLYKFHKNEAWGVVDKTGKVIIPISRGYTKIGRYDARKGVSFEKGRYEGLCDLNGRELSLTKRPFSLDELKQTGGYSSVALIEGCTPKRYKVSKRGYYGIVDADGKVIVEPELEQISPIGGNFLKFKIGSFWGVMDVNGKTIIPTSRGYTYIGRYVASQKIITFSKRNGKGECDATGRQLSFIENQPAQNNSQQQSGQQQNARPQNNNQQQQQPTRVIIEHQHDPVPMQVWVSCNICYGDGRCNTCAGTGRGPGSNGRCLSCGYSGKCRYCNGQGGRYEVQYR